MNLGYILYYGPMEVVFQIIGLNNFVLFIVKLYEQLNPFG
jgi:hypothetical protein